MRLRPFFGAVRVAAIIYLGGYTEIPPSEWPNPGPLSWTLADPASETPVRIQSPLPRQSKRSIMRKVAEDLGVSVSHVKDVYYRGERKAHRVAEALRNAGLEVSGANPNMGTASAPKGPALGDMEQHNLRCITVPVLSSGEYTPGGPAVPDRALFRKAREYRGIFPRVAQRLGVSRGHVYKVAAGVRGSEPVRLALLAEIARIDSEATGRAL